MADLVVKTVEKDVPFPDAQIPNGVSTSVVVAAAGGIR
jgi:hypothetical protein